MASSLSEITDICPESDRYMEKSLCTWYDMHDPGAGYKCYWVTEVRYLGSGSEEKALRRWIANLFLNMGAQYKVETFLWLCNNLCS